MNDINLVAPIEPYQLPKTLRQGMEDIVRRVSARAVIDGRGQDIFLRVYMAGMYHAQMLIEARTEAGAGIAEGGLSERMQPACGSAEAPAATTASADPDSASASSHPSCIAEGGKARDE